MKVVLVDNLLFEGNLSQPRYDLQPHLGLMSLISVMRAAGIKAVIYDPKFELSAGRLRLDARIYDTMASHIAEHNADVVGFTALGCNFPCVVRTAERLKGRRPGRPILLGGPHATILHREILEQFDFFDVVVRHEAERSLPSVLASLGGSTLWADISCVSYRGVDGTIACTEGSSLIDDVDDLLMPAYDAYPIERLGLEEIRVEAGRGCPFSCAFCSTATFFGRQYRLKSAARLVREMDTLHERWGFRAFKLNHDLFTVNRKKVSEFCEAVRGRGYTWSCSARMDCVDAELLTRMQEAGCTDIYFGVEAGSLRMQTISRKRLDLELLEPTLGVTERLGQHSTTSFITGYPEETLADQRQTLDLLGAAHTRASDLNTGQLHLLTPEPGTALIETYGDRLAHDDHISQFNFPMLSDQDTALVAAHPKIFPNHNYFPSVIPRHRHIFVTSLWIALYELGRPTLRCILSAFGSQLSKFVDAAFDWMKTKRPGRHAATVEDVNDFIAHRFGGDHALASIVRFSAVRTRLAQTARAAATTAKFAAGPQGAFAMSSRAALLPDIHDVPKLFLRRKTENPESIFVAPGARADHLLLMTDEETRLFGLNAPTTQLLASLSAPQSYMQLCIAAAKGPGAGLPSLDDLKSLVDLGILELTAAEYKSAS